MDPIKVKFMKVVYGSGGAHRKSEAVRFLLSSLLPSCACALVPEELRIRSWRRKQKGEGHGRRRRRIVANLATFGVKEKEKEEG